MVVYITHPYIHKSIVIATSDQSGVSKIHVHVHMLHVHVHVTYVHVMYTCPCITIIKICH